MSESILKIMSRLRETIELSLRVLFENIIQISKMIQIEGEVLKPFVFEIIEKVYICRINLE